MQITIHINSHRLAPGEPNPWFAVDTDTDTLDRSPIISVLLRVCKTIVLSIPVEIQLYKTNLANNNLHTFNQTIILIFTIQYYTYTTSTLQYTTQWHVPNKQHVNQLIIYWLQQINYVQNDLIYITPQYK